MNGMDSFAQLAGAAGGLMFLLVLLVLALLGLLVPFFVWRIWTWTFRSCQELQQLNAKIDQLANRLAMSGPAQPAGETPTRTAAQVAPVSPLTAASADKPVRGKGPEDLSAEAIAAAATFAPAGAAAVPTPDRDEGEAETSEAGSAEPDFSFAPLEEVPADEPLVSPHPGTAATAEDGATPAPEKTFGFLGETFPEAAPPAEMGEGFAPDPFEPSEQAEPESFDGDFAESPAPPPIAEDRPPAVAAAPADEAPSAVFEEGQPAMEVEPPPAVSKLPQDPQRPMVNLARCGGCGHKLAYKDPLVGKRVKCPACQQAFVLP